MKIIIEIYRENDGQIQKIYNETNHDEFFENYQTFQIFHEENLFGNSKN